MKKDKKYTCLESFIEDNIVYFRDIGCPSPYVIGARGAVRWSCTAIVARGVGAPEARGF